MTIGQARSGLMVNLRAARPSAGDMLLAGLLGAAIEAHQQYRLDEAETIYRLILDKYPRQPDALRLLGVLRFMKRDRRP